MTVKKRVPCLVFSRIVGYMQPISNWNVGKQQEWKDRKVYAVPQHGDPTIPAKEA